MEIVVKNARIVTSDADQPTADALIVRGGRFAFVGSESDLPALDELPVIDLAGRCVIPGLVDAHTHPEMIVNSSWHVTLPPSHDLDEILEFIRQYGLTHPRDEAPYLYFEYYPSTLFGDVEPTAELLDSAISDRPVLCQDFSDHAHWVNTRMLDLLGVTEDTPDPAPGLEMFVRDANGKPTGHVFEMAYAHFLDRMYDALGWRPPRLSADSVAEVIDTFTAWGVTGLFEGLVEDEAMFAALSQLETEGRLAVRYEGSLRFRRLADLPDALARARRCDEVYGSALLRVRTLKLFLDGTNEIGNGAVLEPLLDGGHGELQMDTSELTECMSALNGSGVDLHIHVVGDRAFRVACDAVEAARARAVASGTAWSLQVTLAHCEMIDPADAGRPAELGIIVNWTPHWSGGYFGDEARNHLGESRWERMYDFRDVATGAAVLTFGSDVVTRYELNRAHPFFGMQVGMTRVDPERPLDPATYPGSIRLPEGAQLTRDRLLRGLTIDAARQLRIDDRAGSITVGKSADFVVLSDDILTIDPARLSTVTATAVLFEGELVSGGL